jgi:hypothetical protein
VTDAESLKALESVCPVCGHTARTHWKYDPYANVLSMTVYREGNGCLAGVWEPATHSGHAYERMTTCSCPLTPAEVIHNAKAASA